MTDVIDVIVPRGGLSLIKRVAAESRIPVLKHLDGICHVYIHAAADPEHRTRHDHGQFEDAADRHLRGGGNPAGRSSGCFATVAAADPGRVDRGRMRRCAATPRPGPWIPAMLPAIRYRLGDGIPRCDPVGETGRRHRRGRSPISTVTARTTPRALSQRTMPLPERFFAGVDSAILLQNASTQYRRWRRVRHGGGDRHLHRKAPRPRAGGRRAVDQLQIRRSRQRAGPALTKFAAPPNLYSGPQLGRRPGRADGRLVQSGP